jgi:hypothetical protein
MRLRKERKKYIKKEKKNFTKYKGKKRESEGV